MRTIEEFCHTLHRVTGRATTFLEDDGADAQYDALCRAWRLRERCRRRYCLRCGPTLPVDESYCDWGLRVPKKKEPVSTPTYGDPKTPTVSAYTFRHCEGYAGPAPGVKDFIRDMPRLRAWSPFC